MKSKLNITKELLDKICEHSRKDYPYECCGILIGDFDKRKVLEILPATNIRKDRMNDRFEIAPHDLVEAERRADNLSLDVIGYYHSHPDCPNQASEYDRQRAFPGMSYIIVSVEKGIETQSKSWVLDEENKQFTEEDIIIT